VEIVIDIGILAGGEGRRLKGGDGNGLPKAWVSLRGKFLWRHVYDEAMKLNPGRTFVVCHSHWAGDVPSGESIRVLPKQGSYIRDLFSIIDAAAGLGRLLLIVHADAVLVTVEELSRVAQVAMASEAGFLWPGVPESMCYPESGGRRYVIGGKDLARTGVIAVKPDLIRYDKDLVALMARYDKYGEVIAGVKVLGLRRCVRALEKRLPTPELCDCMGRALGCEVEFPVMNLPKLAFDVDHPEDLAYAEDFFESTQLQEE